MLHYSAADVDDLATDDFLLLCHLLERHQAAETAQTAELARMEGGT